MKRLSFLILFLASTALIFAAGKADDILDRCVKSLSSSPSVTIGYRITSDGNSSTGAMTLSGGRFLLDSPHVAVWFDGKTQWTYAKEQKEVSVTTPTSEELQQLNPLLVLDNFRRNYKTELLKGAPGTASVKLTPKKADDGIDAAVINISESNDHPQSIVLTLFDRRTVSVHILSVRPNIKLSDNSFRFNSTLYPGVEVIDLR